MKKFYIILCLMLATFSSLQAKDIYATFTVEANRSASLAFSSSGIVDGVFVDVGSVVKEDERLAKLQNDDIKAMLEVTRTSLRFAKKDFDRIRSVRKIIDQAQYDRYLAKYAVTKAKLAQQQTLLDKTILRAPFDGVITAKMVEKGDAVSGAMIRTVFKIQSQHARKLILSFDQRYWQDVRVGDRFSYKVDGSKKVYEGVITKIYPVIDKLDRKRKAEVAARDLVVGLNGDGTIHTRVDSDVNSSEKE
jgi:RND family efflux transporter MFP subunit